MDWLVQLSNDPNSLTFALLLGIVLLAIGSSGARRRAFKPHRIPFRPMVVNGLNANVPADAAEQLRAVMLATFNAKPVLSRSEHRVLVAAERAIFELQLPWRMMAQVALGEILASPDEDGFRAINAKRVDLLIVGERSAPLAAIEYQGEGHYQGAAPARDAVKKEALRKAGIGYIEMKPGDGPEDVRREIARLARERGFGKREMVSAQRNAAHAA